eukprot:scaffold9692_cov117-Skeletonema_dohrnii-CCMP3373.AAC.1
MTGHVVSTLFIIIDYFTWKVLYFVLLSPRSAKLSKPRGWRALRRSACTPGVRRGRPAFGVDAWRSACTPGVRHVIWRELRRSA